MIVRPARKAAKIGERLAIEEMSDDINVTKTTIRRKRGVTTRVLIARTRATAVITIHPKRINLSELATKPRYKAGAEAGLGKKYGTGVTYSLYRGIEKQGGFVFQTPSIANPSITGSGSPLADERKFFIRESASTKKFPVRAWRGPGLASWWHGERGQRQLAGYGKEVYAEVFEGKPRTCSDVEKWPSHPFKFKTI